MMECWNVGIVEYWKNIGMMNDGVRYFQAVREFKLKTKN
jgi:hypothetical protein